jgi:hypothetical protein
MLDSLEDEDEDGGTTALEEEEGVGEDGGGGVEVTGGDGVEVGRLGALCCGSVRSVDGGTQVHSSRK